MFDESLPTDLEQVEQDIVTLMRFDPQAEFGRRVIGAMRAEMRHERTAARWKFALGLAAGAFLWLHLSFYAASVTDFHFRGAPPPMRVNPSAAEPHTGFPNALGSEWSMKELKPRSGDSQ